MSPKLLQEKTTPRTLRKKLCKGRMSQELLRKTSKVQKPERVTNSLWLLKRAVLRERTWRMKWLSEMLAE